MAGWLDSIGPVVGFCTANVSALCLWTRALAAVVVVLFTDLCVFVVDGALVRRWCIEHDTIGMYYNTNRLYHSLHTFWFIYS